MNETENNDISSTNEDKGDIRGNVDDVSGVPPLVLPMSETVKDTIERSMPIAISPDNPSETKEIRESLLISSADMSVNIVGSACNASQLSVVPEPPIPTEECSSCTNDAIVLQPFRTQIRAKHFPNGMAGIPYQHEMLLEFNLPTVAQPEILSVGLNNDAMGLTVALNNNRIIIEGLPKEKGILRIWIEYRIGGTQSLREEFPEVTIFPDPKALWRNLPHDLNAPYQTEDEISASQFGISGKGLIAASKRGRSHAHDGKFRDDAFCFDWLPLTGWLIVAVSDGAGSAEFSRKGAQIACETFVDELSMKLSSTETNEKLQSIPDKRGQDLALERLLLEIAHQAAKNIQDEAKAKNCSVKKYSATFLGYIAKKLGEEWLIVSVGIGDGAIGLIDSEGKLSLLNEPDGGEYVGQTRFLTTPEVWQDGHKRTFSVRVRDFQCLCSMTDGVSDPKFETDNKLKDSFIWEKFWNDLKTSPDANIHFELRDATLQNELLTWLDFWSKGNHDDRTLTILY